MKPKVHASRGYLAGFGTSGSLLAGAALLFVLGSAIVAFRGWPEIATGPATTNVSAPQLAGPSHVTRHLAALLGTRLSGRHPSLVAAATARHPGRQVAGKSVGRVRGATTSTSTSSATPGSGSTPSAGAAGSAGSCSGTGCQGPSGQSLITGVSTTVAKQVNDIGAQVGSQTQSTAGTVAGAVSGVSPQAASTVQSTGNAVGNVVTNAGSALGGGH
jgi:hypothetical protein